MNNPQAFILSFFSLVFTGIAGAETLKIAVLAPLTGTISAIGTDVKTGAELAINQRKNEFARLGFDIQPLILDDKGDPTTGVQLVKDILQDPKVVGIVGPIKSGVSLKVGELLASVPSPLGMISPSSTSDDLTKKGWNFFFRVIAPGGAQSVLAATYISTVVKPKGVYIEGDNTTLANFLSGAMAQELKKVGVAVVGIGSASVGDTKGVQAEVSRIKASKADVVFHTGLYDSGAPMITALRAAGNKALFMGGNGLDSPDFIRLAQGDAAGVRFVTGLGPVNNYVNGFQFTQTYQKAFGTLPAARSVFTYDAMNVMLDAVMATLKQGKTPSRVQVLMQLPKVNLPTDRSVTGSVSFTANGERRSSPMFIVEINPQNLQSNVVYVKRFTIGF